MTAIRKPDVSLIKDSVKEKVDYLTIGMKMKENEEGETGGGPKCVTG